MKKTILLAIIVLLGGVQTHAESISIDTSYCSGENMLPCIKKAYNKKIIIHSGKMKRDFNVSQNLISKIDKKFENFSTNRNNLKRISERISKELELLGNSEKDTRMKQLLYYVAYKSQYSMVIIDLEKNEKNKTSSLDTNNQGEATKAESRLKNKAGRSRDTGRIMNVEMIHRLIEVYYTDNYKLPDIIDNVDGRGYSYLDPSIKSEFNGCKAGLEYEKYTKDGEDCYTLLVCMESDKGANDGGKFDNKYETSYCY